MGVSEPFSRPSASAKRSSRFLPVITSIGVLALGTALVIGRLRGEGAAIGACARDAMVLSMFTEKARGLLYADTDNFLGKVAITELLKPVALEHLEKARARAAVGASEVNAFLLRESAGEAKEMFLAAEQESNLALKPRGTWLTFMSDTARAQGTFEAARGRYRLSRSSWVSGDDQSAVDREVNAVMKNMLEAQGPIIEREARRLGVGTPAHWPTDEATRAFDWHWEDAGTVSSSGGTRRLARLLYRNRMERTISGLQIKVGGLELEGQANSTAHPDLWYSVSIWVSGAGQPPAPTFSGRFAD